MERSTIEEIYTDVEEVICPECGYVFDLTIQGDSKHEENKGKVRCPDCYKIVIPGKRD